MLPGAPAPTQKNPKRKHKILILMEMMTVGSWKGLMKGHLRTWPSTWFRRGCWDTITPSSRLDIKTISIIKEGIHCTASTKGGPGPKTRRGEQRLPSAEPQKWRNGILSQKPNVESNRATKEQKKFLNFVEIPVIPDLHLYWSLRVIITHCNGR